MSKSIEYVNVSKVYGDKRVIDNFNLKIKPGEFLSMVGSSGSGKTTLMKMINGLILPTEGQILIGSNEIRNEDLIALRRKIGYVIQGNGLFPHMTVAENIAYVLKLERWPKLQIQSKVAEVLELVRLPKAVSQRYPAELSGGQQQRVGIARAYANEPDILLMDEPFGAIDAINRYNLQMDLKEIHRCSKCTVVFITHDIGEAIKLSNNILVLDKGEIQQYGTPEEVWNNPGNEFVAQLVAMTK